MRFLKYILIGLAVIALGLVLVRRVFAVQIGEAAFRTAAKSTLAKNPVADLPDGLAVILVGTGSPLPDPTRAGPMTVVAAGGKLFAVDAGGGTARRFGEFALPWGQLEAVLLTHYHSDHIDGLGEVILQHWAGGGSDAPLPVYGPVGLDWVVDGVNLTYAQDTTYRIAHHGEEVVPPDGAGAVAHVFEESGRPVVVHDQDGLTITAVAVKHDPVHPAVAYRFDYLGRSVTVSGDTAKSQALIELSASTDILVHEALNADMVGVLGNELAARSQPRLAKIMADIPGYHTTPVEAAESAAEAGADMLVLSHIIPVLPSRALYPAYLKGTKAAYDGPIILGEDGMMFVLPEGSEKIMRKRVD